MRKTFLIVVLNFAKVITDEMEGRVVKGRATKIERHPHSVYLFLHDEYAGGSSCGGSIVNQKILLTAAHCFERPSASRKITAIVGSSLIEKGRPILVIAVRVHPHYEPISISNDIALAGLKDPIVFGTYAKRVVIAKKQRGEGIAKLAGWGMVQEFPQYKTGDYLHEVALPFMSREKCEKILSRPLNRGTFCGGELHAQSYPSIGDSGSPLVIDGYLQIGLLSYRTIRLSRSISIYTDVPYFHDWITKNAKSVFCKKEKKSKEEEVFTNFKSLSSSEDNLLKVPTPD